MTYEDVLSFCEEQDVRFKVAPVSRTINKKGLKIK